MQEEKQGANVWLDSNLWFDSGAFAALEQEPLGDRLALDPFQPTRLSRHPHAWRLIDVGV